ncbi:MAG TPA: PepSY domain-containing protein [Opitutaceae bacterium]|nr:PepSY domain-containing protein [Opitutaceae bacterium]
MKNTLRLLCAASCFAALVAGPALQAADKAENPEPQGSIRPTGKMKPADLPALAKISFQEATSAALKAVPGSVLKAELEIEDGNLMYSFEIVGADKAVTEVEIDAGNGQVLGTEKETGAKEDHQAEAKKHKQHDREDKD